jgi:hypothetical protein
MKQSLENTEAAKFRRQMVRELRWDKYRVGFLLMLSVSAICTLTLLVSEISKALDPRVLAYQEQSQNESLIPGPINEMLINGTVLQIGNDVGMCTGTATNEIDLGGEAFLEVMYVEHCLHDGTNHYVKLSETDIKIPASRVKCEQYLSESVDNVALCGMTIPNDAANLIESIDRRSVDVDYVPQINEEIFQVGFPGILRPTLEEFSGQFIARPLTSNGVIVKQEKQFELDGSVNVICTDAEIGNGMSGGPTFVNTRDGLKVAGLLARFCDSTVPPGQVGSVDSTDGAFIPLPDDFWTWEGQFVENWLADYPLR